MTWNTNLGYIDEDVTYLLGSIVARGTVDYEKGTIVIEYPFRYLELDGIRVTNEIIISLDQVVKRFQELDFKVFKNVERDKKRISIVLEKDPTSIAMRIIKEHLKERREHYEFEVPNVLFHANESVAKEFIRGYADVAGHIRSSNRDKKGFHRVYLDVLNRNWHLPVQLCNLLMMKLNVPVHTIAWGHPVIRDPDAKKGVSFWKKEHQIKIYAHDFKHIGFYISHKWELLKRYADENEKRLSSGEKPCHKGCDAEIKKKESRGHPNLCDVDLPDVLRCKPIRDFREICILMGCKLATSRSQ